MSEDASGRLIRYDRCSKEITILLRGLAFANGVSLSEDCSLVLVAETTTCRIIRLWLKEIMTFFAELPGFPDKIRSNSKGDQY